jgi:transglutaminase-like putative cysteine protease
VRLARLHRRLVALMAFAALVAFGAGFGLRSPEVVLAALVLGVALVWQTPPEWSARMERISRAVLILLFLWILYVTFVIEGDFLIPVLGMLLLLLATEMLRPLETQNDLRLYSLSFALLIAATAYSPGPLFGGAFVTYIALTTLALMVGHLRRQAERFHIADVRIGRPFLAATAALSGVTVLMSVALFVIFPRLPRNWLGATRAAAQQAMVGFGEGVSLAEFGSRIYPNPEVVFRVEFPSERPANTESLHWRGRSYDFFDGMRWSRSRMIPLSPRSAFYAERWPGPRLEYQIFGGPPGVQLMFGTHPILDIDPRSRIRPIREPSGDIVFAGSENPVYHVTSAALLPPESVLRNIPEQDGPALAPYLQLPRLSPRVAQLADSLTQGQPTRYDRARAVESYFKREFGYTLDLPPTAAQATLEYFLFERREGHCEYFSTAMAILLRSVGIPARNVNGFLGGEWNADRRYLAVTQNDAHSWVEVWFPELGWVPFDPTPAAVRAQVAGIGAATSWRWPVRFWLDGIEHQWFKWVLYYDLDKQIQVLRGVSDMFTPASVSMPRARGRVAVGPLVPWLLGAGGVLLLIWLLRGQWRSPYSPEVRLYLALRRTYQRAGLLPANAGTPLVLAGTLRQAGAPGARPAERLIRLYLRARFAGEDIGAEGRQEMEDALTAVRDALKRKKIHQFVPVTD